MFKRKSFSFRLISSLLIVLFTNLTLFPCVRAAGLPAPSQFVPLSAGYSFPVLKGLRFDPQNPLNVEFIIHKGNKNKISEDEAMRLVRYFLAGLTIPEENLWVNLSVNEKDRVIPESLGETELGEGLLSQDYILKQLLSSLTYPESKTGKNFWQKAYSKIAKISGASNTPVDTYNKIWIMPESSLVYENNNMAVVADAKLKTLLEEDYVALRAAEGKGHRAEGQSQKRQANKAASEAMKEVILDKINKDVNSGKNFAALRQIYQSVILSTWFKKKFKESFYKHYINKEKISGVDLADADAKNKIYSQYVEAFKTGLYDYVKKEKDPVSKKQVKRRYYSGGATFSGTGSSSQVLASPVGVNKVIMTDARAGAIELFNMEFEALSSSLKKYVVDEERTGIQGTSISIAVPVAEEAESKTKDLADKKIWKKVQDGAKKAFMLLGERAREPLETMTGWKKWPSIMAEDLNKQGLFKAARDLRDKINSGEVSNLVIAGIGGSAAPLESELDLLFGKGWRNNSIKGVRIHLLDTLDEEEIGDTLKEADLDATALLIISKSGGTLEPLVISRIFKNRLAVEHGQETYPAFVYVVTDKAKGALRKETDEKGYTVAGIVPDDIGGRFSIFSAVGMFIVAVFDQDTADHISQQAIREIRNGAQAYEDYEYENRYPENIVAVEIGGLAALYNKEYHSDLIFRYYGEGWQGEKTFLEQKNDESVVEENKGPWAFLIDGANKRLDKVYNKGKHVNIHLIVDEQFRNNPELEERFKYQYKRLKAHGIPQIVIRMPKMNEYYLGFYMQLMHNIIGYCGEFLLDNPNLTYLQSGVEDAKIYFKAMAGDPSLKNSEEIKNELSKIFAGNGRFVFGNLNLTNAGKALASLGMNLNPADRQGGKVYVDLNNLLQTGFTEDEIKIRADQIRGLLDSKQIDTRGIEGMDVIAAANLAAAWQLKKEKAKTAQKDLNTNVFVYSHSLYGELYEEDFQGFSAENNMRVRIAEAPACHHSVQNGMKNGDHEKAFHILAMVDDHGRGLAVPADKDDYLDGKSLNYLLALTGIAVSGAATKAGASNVMVTVKHKKDQQYLKNFLELTTVLAGLSSPVKGTQDVESASSSLKLENVANNRPTQAGGIDLESLNSSVEASSSISTGGLDLDFKSCVGVTVRMIGRRTIKPDDKILSFAK